MRRLLAPTPGLVLSLLWDARGAVVPIDCIIDRLYAGDSDGGPLNAGNVVCVAVSRLGDLGADIEQVVIYRCHDRRPPVTAPQHLAVLAAMRVGNRTRHEIGSVTGLTAEEVFVAISKLRSRGVRIESVSGYRIVASYDRVTAPAGQRDQLAA